MPKLKADWPCFTENYLNQPKISRLGGMMKLSKLMTKKGLVFLLIFSILVFIGDRINFSRLVGADNQFFTLFQFFGPVAGAFLGPVVGVLSVLIAEVASKIYTHAAWDIITILRLLP